MATFSSAGLGKPSGTTTAHLTEAANLLALLDEPLPVRKLPNMTREVLRQLPDLADTAPSGMSASAHAVGTALMKQTHANPRTYAAMTRYLMLKMPAIAAQNPVVGHGLFRAVLDDVLETQNIRYTQIARDGFAWRDGRLSPAYGGQSPTLVIYPTSPKQPAIVANAGFSGPLLDFANVAMRNRQQNPQSWPHYGQLLQNAQNDLRERNKLPSFNAAVQALKR